jgi:hypothetical protein
MVVGGSVSYLGHHEKGVWSSFYRAVKHHLTQLEKRPPKKGQKKKILSLGNKVREQFAILHDKPTPTDERNEARNQLIELFPLQ